MAAGIFLCHRHALKRFKNQSTRIDDVIISMSKKYFCSCLSNEQKIDIIVL